MYAKRKTLLTRIVTPGGDDPLLLRLVAPKVIRTGSAVSGISLVGQGGAGGYAYSILTGSAYGSLPPGLTLNADGTITGTPTTVGHYAFVAQVQDADSSVYTAAFSLHIQSQLVAGAGRVRAGEVGLAYTYTFRVTGNTGAVTWTIESGNLPAGLSLDGSTGTVSGTPTADSNGLGGTSYFTIRATDGGSGQFLDIPSSILIYEELSFDFAARIGPEIIPIGVSNVAPAVAGTTNSYTTLIEGGAPPYKFTTYVTVGPTLKVWFDKNLLAVMMNSTQDDVGYASYRATIQDSLGASRAIYFGQEIVSALNQVIQPRIGGADVGDNNIAAINFEDGANTTVEVTNSSGVVTVKVNAPGGGSGSGIDTINGAAPDSSGNVQLVSPDSSVGIAINSSGEIELTAASGGVGSVGGATPDSNGDVPVTSSDSSIIPAVDSNGQLDLTVNPATRGPTVNFHNGTLALTGTIRFEIPDMPYGGTITGWRIVGDASGDASIIVQRATYADYNTMTTLFTATCSGAIKAEASGLNHPFSAGDVLRFEGSGFANMTRCAIKLTVG